MSGAQRRPRGGADASRGRYVLSEDNFVQPIAETLPSKKLSAMQKMYQSEKKAMEKANELDSGARGGCFATGFTAPHAQADRTSN